MITDQKKLDWEMKELKCQINDLCMTYVSDFRKSEELAYKITKLVIEKIEMERVMRR